MHEGDSGSAARLTERVQEYDNAQTCEGMPQAKRAAEAALQP